MVVQPTVCLKKRYACDATRGRWEGAGTFVVGEPILRGFRQHGQIRATFAGDELLIDPRQPVTGEHVSVTGHQVP